MTPENLAHLSSLRGLVATVVTSGSVDDSFSQCYQDLRSWCDRNDFHAIEWRTFRSPFVEQGRDEVLSHTLKEGYEWCLQIDADAAPFEPGLLARLLETAFITHPDADVVGAYAQLKHPPYLPTIDTGTGTWEVHYPGEGVLPVIRTGAHCILTKSRILHKFGPPWFRTRTTIPPIKALAEIDNFARTHTSGLNPLASTAAWKTLMGEAKKLPPEVESQVGEDSGFCDAVRAAGGTIYVNTDLWVGHVSKRVIEPSMLQESMEEMETRRRMSVGVY